MNTVSPGYVETDHGDGDPRRKCATQIVASDPDGPPRQARGNRRGWSRSSRRRRRATSPARTSRSTAAAHVLTRGDRAQPSPRRRIAARPRYRFRNSALGKRSRHPSRDRSCVSAPLRRRGPGRASRLTLVASTRSRPVTASAVVAENKPGGGDVGSLLANSQRSWRRIDACRVRRLDVRPMRGSPAHALLLASDASPRRSGSLLAPTRNRPGRADLADRRATAGRATMPRRSCSTPPPDKVYAAVVGGGPAGAQRITITAAGSGSDALMPVHATASR